MMQRIVRRSLRGAFVIFAATSAMFFVAHGIGDPAVGVLGPNARIDQLGRFRDEHGLNEPLVARYGRFITRALRGDLGTSFLNGEPVMTVVLRRLPRTALLMGLALLLELGFGVAVGTVAALRHNAPLDALLMGLCYLGISVPTFLSGLVFLYALSFRLGWFPIGGYGTGPLDHLYHALLPALTLSVIGAATYARVMRAELLDVLHADYIRTARAKGLSAARILFVHAMPNALLPVVTLVGLQLPTLVGGAIITEHIFGWPGMGRLAVEAITALDVPVILGIVFFASCAVQIGNGLADLAAAWLDPRIRIG